MNEWQPIESAPKDGTPILAYVVDADWDVGEDCSSPRSTYKPFIAAVYYDKGFLGEWCFVEDFNVVATAEPTHWMPLPSPPPSTPKQGEGE